MSDVFIIYTQSNIPILKNILHKKYQHVYIATRTYKPNVSSYELKIYQKKMFCRKVNIYSKYLNCYGCIKHLINKMFVTRIDNIRCKDIDDFLACSVNSFTCIGYIKKILGINNKRIITPYDLLKYTIKNKMVYNIHEK